MNGSYLITNVPPSILEALFTLLIVCVLSVIWILWVTKE